MAGKKKSHTTKRFNFFEYSRCFISNKKDIYYTKRFWATTFTLSGTIIGAGILGLPYVFSQSGYFLVCSGCCF
jgi:hypothetical protein